jgi:5,10-methylenetetrahydromethanopterin reductase
MRIAIATQNKTSLDSTLEVAKAAERNGFESLWACENPYYRDAFATLSAVSVATTRIGLATGIIPCYTRHPVLAAMGASAISQDSGGRFSLGVGTGAVTTIRDQMGYRFDHPLQVLTEYVTIVRELLAGKKVTVSTPNYRITNVALTTPPMQKVPVYVAAVGSKTLKMTGETADGVLLDYGTSPYYVKHAVTQVVEAAKEKGRCKEDIDVASLVWCSLSNDRKKALELIKPALAYLLSIPRLGEALLEGSSEDSALSAKLREYYYPSGGKHDLMGAAKIVDEVTAKHLAVVGNRDDCVARLQDYYEAGLRLPVLVPMNDEMAFDIIDAFAAQTAPAI